MSANNGNRSRFHRDRKRRIARRMQMRSVMNTLDEKRSAVPAPPAPDAKKRASVKAN
jgi:hypothetical protein